MGDSATAGTTTLVAQEEARLRQLHPTPEDIPTCMTVFDGFLTCNSTPFSFSALPSGSQVKKSSSYTTQVDIPLRRDGALF
jgi:hypothetical protein